MQPCPSRLEPQRTQAGVAAAQQLATTTFYRPTAPCKTIWVTVRNSGRTCMVVTTHQSDQVVIVGALLILNSWRDLE